MRSNAYVSVIEPAAENNWSDPTMVVAVTDLGGNDTTSQISMATARRLVRELEVGLAACERINRKTRNRS